MPSVCVHCADKACVKACPRGACILGKDYIVSVINDRCTGCGACTRACKSGGVRVLAATNVRELLPKSGRFPSVDTPTRRVVKCDLCYGFKRLACVHNCPTGALSVSCVAISASDSKKVEEQTVIG